MDWIILIVGIVIGFTCALVALGIEMAATRKRIR